MEWIDSMRGFTMILVVANHMSTIGYGEALKGSTYLSIFLLFRMPLFFFISGFFSYSAKTQWSLKTLGTLTLKKIRIQIIPTAVFFCLAAAILTPHFLDTCVDWLHKSMKGGYWFTIVLLELFLIYYVFAYLESLGKKWLQRWKIEWLPITLFWLIALGIYATWYMPSWFHYQNDDWLKWSSFSQVILYLHFFLAGNIVHRYWNGFQRLFDTKWFAPIVLTVGTIALCEFLNWHELRRQWANLPRTLAMYSLVTTTLLFFRHYASSFSKETRIGRGLQYIGVRTLDVYLLHYFFIPRIPVVGEWIKSIGRNFAVDITCSFAGALVVVGICLLTSNIIRISPFLKLYLFGRK